MWFLGLVIGASIGAVGGAQGAILHRSRSVDACDRLCLTGASLHSCGNKMKVLIVMLLLAQSAAIAAERPEDFAYGIPIHAGARNAL